MAATRTTLEILLAFKDTLSGGLIKAEKGILNFAKRGLSGIKGLLGSLLNLKTAILGVGGVLAVGGAASLVKRVADLGDKLLKTSQKTGITVENLSRLSHAAGMSGVEIDELGRSFVIAEKGIQGFRMGSNELKDVMELMGKEFENAVRRGESMEELLPELIDGFNALWNEEEKVVVATKLFGKSGADLIPFLEEGRDKIEELFKESDRLRLTWSRGDAEAADTFGDAIDRLKGSMFGLLQEVIKPLLPSFTKWLDSMSEFVVTHRDDVLNFFAGLVDWGAQLADTVLPRLESGFRILFTTMKAFLGPVLKVGQTLAAREYLNAKEDLDVLLQEIQDEKAAGSAGSPNRLKLAQQGVGPARARFRRADEDLMRYGAAERALELGLPPPPGAQESLGDALRRRAASPVGQEAPWSGIGPPAITGQKPDRTRTAKDTTSAYAGMISGLDQLTAQWTNAFQRMESSVLAIGSSLEENVTGGLLDAINGTKKAKDAFRDMAKGILLDLQKLAIQKAITGAIGGILGGLGFGGTDTTALKKNAIGTARTHGPEIAGEAGAEAVIPLKGGRFVPVELAGNTGMTIINFNIQAIDAKSFNERFRAGVSANREMIASAHQQQFQNRPEFRRSYR